MKRFHRTLAFSLLIVMLLAACNNPQVQPTTTAAPTLPPLETIVAETLAALPEAMTPTTPADAPATSTPWPTVTSAVQLTPTPTLTLTPTKPPALAFNVIGQVCYPGDAGIPEMVLYFEDVSTGKVVEQKSAAGRSAYQVMLPPGKYRAYAWLPDFSRGGMYTQAVICGGGDACTDHLPVLFDVTANSMTEGVDVCDWYAYQMPYPPGQDASGVTGSIGGALSYPGGSIPALRVVAYNLRTQNWYFVVTNPGWGSYTLDTLPPGVYHVVAYTDSGRAGGYTRDGQLADVVVRSGQLTENVDINAWDGAFPPDPTR